MGISEKIEKMADEKELQRSHQDIDKLFNSLKNLEVEGMDEILIELKNLKETELYKRLINAFKTENSKQKDRLITSEELSTVPILKLADENLIFGDLLTNVFTASLIFAKLFLSIYSFIEYIYCMTQERPTNWADILNIFFSGLDERIIFALEKFDEVDLEDIPEPTTEYFQMLRKVRWKDKKAKKTYDKLTKLMFEMMYLKLDFPAFKKWPSTYRSTEDLFIRLLSGCSAVNNDRVNIEAEDVVIAYKTFFKLIKTDVTKYKAIPERLYGIEGYNNSLKVGYLVCQKCGGYYQLQPGESPEDFTDECDCGGHFECRTTLYD